MKPFVWFLMLVPVVFLPQRITFGAEVYVTLFGKKCLLSGRQYSKPSLEAVHAISPERVPPAFSARQIDETLEQFGQIKKSLKIVVSLWGKNEKVGRRSCLLASGFLG